MQLLPPSYYILLLVCRSRCKCVIQGLEDVIRRLAVIDVGERQFGYYHHEVRVEHGKVLFLLDELLQLTVILLKEHAVYCFPISIKLGKYYCIGCNVSILRLSGY